MKMYILGDFVRVSGKKYEVEEMTRLLRNTVLDGSERSRVVCKTSSMLSKIATNAKYEDINERFAFRGLSEHFKSIMTDLLPKSFYDIKFKEVNKEPEEATNYIMYGVTKGREYELFVFNIDSDKRIQPVFVPKDYKDEELVKQTEIEK